MTHLTQITGKNATQFPQFRKFCDTLKNPNVQYFEQDDMFSIVKVIMSFKLVFITERQSCYNSVFFSIIKKG